VAGAAKIQIRGLWKEFRQQQVLSVLEGITLDVQEGEFVSLLGTSGCGKTTLLNIVAGFIPPSRGEVTVDGRPVVAPGPERGVIFQQYAVFPWLSVQDNITFGLTLSANRLGPAERGAIARRYIDLMGLRGFEHAYPKTLSGGMKQRVAIARAYAVSPAILLMDEPFGALDAQTRDAMQELLLDIFTQERRTVLFVTHSVEEAVLLSGRIAVMTARPGRVREIIPIPRGYPRDAEWRSRTSPEFLAIREQVEGLIRHEYAHTEGGGGRLTAPDPAR
jgi:NitT/TauT family transport system ATP-binding protein